MTFLEGDIETAVQVCYFAISSYLETLNGMVIILIKTVKLISSLRSLVLLWSNKSCCKNLLNLLAHLLDNFQSSVFARSSISSFVEHFSRKSRWVLGSALFKWTVRISFLLELLSIWCQYKRMRRSTAEQGLSQIHFFGTHNTSTRSSSLKINVFLVYISFINLKIIILLVHISLTFVSWFLLHACLVLSSYLLKECTLK